MSGLQRQVIIHDCQPPNVTSVEYRHQWTCDACAAKWEWTPRMTWLESESYGFLGLRSRTTTRSMGGRWHSDIRQRMSWTVVRDES